METRTRHTRIKKVEFIAEAGADVFDCINSCIAFSAENGIPCSLSHNGVEVEISTSELANKIYKK
jgi:hypothetical protein